MSNWRDMSTAPKDGTEILAARWNGCSWDYYVVWWLGHGVYPWESYNNLAEDKFDVWQPIVGPNPPEEFFPSDEVQS